MNFIHLYYLLREQGRQRRYSSAVFHNSANRTKEEVEQIIKVHLVDEVFFDHSKWGVRSLATDPSANPENQPVLHEYVGLSTIDDIPLVVATDLEEFLSLVRNSKK